MRLRGVKSSRNVDDRRRAGGKRRGGGIGLFGVLIILAIGYFAGIDVTPLLNQTAAPSQSQATSAEQDQAADFSTRVLATTEEVWDDIFANQLDRDYTPPVLVLFSGVTQSPCGGASGATGPFYCPLDQKAYLDTDFFVVLQRQMGAGGDFAAAYVIAHEVAHHVQNQLGILAPLEQARRQATKVEANALTVRLELQADCLAGVWANQVGELLEPGDIDEALNAAARIGDDHLQRQAGQVPRPHTFTHGTSKQRAGWFARGYQSGDLSQCDTFGAANL
jgi:predicted metalloprotease